MEEKTAVKQIRNPMTGKDINVGGEAYKNLTRHHEFTLFNREHDFRLVKGVQRECALLGLSLGAPKHRYIHEEVFFFSFFYLFKKYY